MLAITNSSYWCLNYLLPKFWRQYFLIIC